MHVQQFRLKGTYEIKKNRKTSSRKFAGGEEKQSGVCAFHRVKGTGDSSARDRLSRPRFSYACSEYHMGQQNCATYFTVRTAFFLSLLQDARASSKFKFGKLHELHQPPPTSTTTSLPLLRSRLHRTSPIEPDHCQFTLYILSNAIPTIFLFQ